MISLRKPTENVIHRHLADQSGRSFSYAQQGITNREPAVNPPPGYVVDHTRVKLGSGESTYLAATRAIRGWQQFALGWLVATPADAPLRKDTVVAVVARTGGVWSVNCARIVYTIDDQQTAVRRFGFAYGTLPDHVESGEERFLIEWDTTEGGVYYDILAFSRPRHALARLGYPIVRRWQRRFGRDSTAAMIRAVRAENEAAIGPQ